MIRLPPCAVPETAHVVSQPAPVWQGPEPQGPSVGLGEALALDDGLSDGEGVAVGVGATVSARVGERVGATVEPQAARPTATIAEAKRVVSLMAAPSQRQHVIHSYENAL
jgi:hypothetical protein